MFERRLDMLDDLPRRRFGLDDIAMNTQAVEACRGFFFAEVGQDDDGHLLAARKLADTAERLDATHVGHLEVE